MTKWANLIKIDNVLQIASELYDDESSAIKARHSFGSYASSRIAYYGFPVQIEVLDEAAIFSR